MFFVARSASEMSGCVSLLAGVFGYMPLVRSEVRMDPLLFRDDVATWRKKYRQLENLF